MSGGWEQQKGPENEGQAFFKVSSHRPERRLSDRLTALSRSDSGPRGQQDLTPSHKDDKLESPVSTAALALGLP